MDEANEKHDEQSQEKASRDELSNTAVSPLTFEPGETAENANREKELISASNSSKEDEIMSSKVPSKTKVIRKGPVKKKTTTGASSRNKIQSKLKLKEEMRDSDSEGSSSDDKFMEEFESDGSDFSSSTDSDDLSQEFSDEDRLMEYYEKKLREHAIVGNFGCNSDFSEDSEPSQELKKLVEDTFKPKPPEKRNQANDSATSSAKKAANISQRDQDKLAKTSGKLQLTKGIATARKSPDTVKVNMKTVISGLKSEKSAVKEPVSKNVRGPKLVSANRKPAKKVNNTPASLDDHRTRVASKPNRNFLNPLDLTKPGSNRTNSHAVSRTSSTEPNFGRGAQQNDHCRAAGEDIESYQKVADYLARIKQVQNSISEITRKINVDAEESADLEILKSARAAILEQRDRNKKSAARVRQKRNDVPTSTSGSTTASESGSAFSEKQLKDEVVDRILNATLGVS